MASRIPGQDPVPQVQSLLGLVGIGDVDRTRVWCVVVRNGPGEPDLLNPTAEVPKGINPERWKAMKLSGQESLNEAAVVLLGDTPEEDALISTTFAVIQEGMYGGLPSLTVVCPFKEDVFGRFPGYGRGSVATREAASASIE